MTVAPPLALVPSNVPYAGWVSLANTIPWRGVSLTRYRAQSCELHDVEVPEFCVALSKTSPNVFEYREDGGSWRRSPIPVGGVSFVPGGCRVSVQWQGAPDAINLKISSSWLISPEGTSLRMPERPTYDVGDKLIAHLMEEMYRDNLAGAPHGLVYGETLALAALHRVGALESKCKVETDAIKVARSIVLAIDYIHGNLDEKLSLKEIVDATNWTTNIFSFIRAFRRHCGKAPHQYIIELRLDRAKAILLNSGRSVTDVALSCGFSSLSHFSGAFKKCYGVSPSQFSRHPAAHCLTQTAKI
ncbi:MAG: hypothetical protein CFE43_05370 [Burkholderiales bacterium PBB3]|nr:MAG: hypothetical protein CFE43_05370 [Burkholderiales bacterium PBB3]